MNEARLKKSCSIGCIITKLDLATLGESLRKYLNDMNLSIIRCAARDDHSFRASAIVTEHLVAEINNGKDYACPDCGIRLEFKPWESDKTCRCETCNKSYDFTECTVRSYAANELGFAEFVGRTIGEKYAQKCGRGIYRVGKVGDRDAFFAVSPSEGFFNSHDKDTLVVLADPETNIPRGWSDNNCKAVFFAELYYLSKDKREIRIADGVLKRIIPTKSEPRFGKRRRINERRDLWLDFFINILSKKYDDSWFCKKTKSLHCKKVAAWFCLRLGKKDALGDRTIRRDIQKFLTFDASRDKYDSREELIAKLLEVAMNPNESQTFRSKLANSIAHLRIDLNERSRKNGGIPVEITSSAWQRIGNDGMCERVAVATPDDAYFEEMDKRMTLKSAC